MMAYNKRAKEYLEALEIAIEILETNSSIDVEMKKRMMEYTRLEINLTLNREKKFRNISSLSISEKEYFTYWNEATGDHVEKFWNEIRNAELNYKRKNYLEDILKRNRIKNIHEFNYVVDTLIIAQQEERISTKEAKLLNDYLADFEKRNEGKY
jgi:hypothetical protein